MSIPNPFSSRWWLVFPLCALLTMLGLDYVRVQDVRRVSAIGRETIENESGRPRGHWLVVPEHNSRSYQWLSETEQMVSQGEGRVRFVAYENAPLGREVNSASPYRWWLGFVHWLGSFGPSPARGLAWEWTAWWAGPLLHALILLVSVVVIARRFGPVAATLVSFGLVGLFPLAGEFLPGVPDDHGLAIAVAWASVLFLLDAVQSGRKNGFLLAGIVGGLGLWINVAVQVPVLLGLGAGALLLALWNKFTRDPGSPDPQRWNRWALAGATTSLVTYFAEYYPGHLEMRLQCNHPLYGVAWIGLGGLLTSLQAWSRGQGRPKGRVIVATLFAVGALAALPVTMALTHSVGFLVANPQASRLTPLPNGAVATNLARGMTTEGQALSFIATLLPFCALFPTAWSLFRRKVDSATKAAALIAGAVLLTCSVFACVQLQWWTMAQFALLSWLVVTAAFQNRRSWLFVAFCVIPGLIPLTGALRKGANSPLTRLEIEGLVERDLAHWIADHAEEPGAIVLAAPEHTPGFYFYAGLRGLGSPSWENRDGLAAAVNILGATTADEAQALLERRGVKYLVLPSWDTEMDEFVRWTKSNPADTFLAALRRWAIPPWLQPLPYRLPEIGGFEGQSVLLLKVTGDTDRALSLSRLADYALEMQDPALTAAVADALQAFPANFVALIGRAQIEKARGNGPAFDQAFASLQQNLTNGLDRLLPWDRRLSLVVVLAQVHRNELALPQLRRCVADLTEARLRSLSPDSLYRLLVLSKALDVPFAQPTLRELALTLLPADARARL